MISQKTIEEVKARASLLDIVGESVQLKRQGSGYSGLCPFHSERSPSFHVRDNEQYFHCFGCGKSGNVFTYIMEQKGFSFPEAVEDLANRYGIEIERLGFSKQQKNNQNLTKDLYALNEQAYLFFKDQLSKRDPKVVAYAKERRLTRDSVQAFGIGFAPLGNQFTQWITKKGISPEVLQQSGLVRKNSRGEQYDALRGRMVFPIFIDNKRIAGFGGRIIPEYQEKDSVAPKYLNSPETPVYHKSKILFGLPQAFAAIKEQHAAFVVEGYMDVIGLWQAGVRNVVATCGTALTEDHVKKLSRLTKQIILLFDGDNAGRAAAAKSFVTFLNAPVDVWAVYLDQDEDPDTIAIQYGEKTGEFLAQRKRVSLLDAYFESLLKNYGTTTIDTLGPSTRGTLASEIAVHIRTVKDSIAQLELSKKAAYALKIPLERFEQVLSGTQIKQVQTMASPSTDSHGEARAFSDLPKLDQSLLGLVMGKKEGFIDKVLKHPILSQALSSTARGFIESLDVIIAGNPDESARKEETKLLLKQYGSDWTEQWKRAHELYGDPGSNAERQFDDCVILAQKSELTRLLESIQREVLAAADEGEKASLLQQVVEIQRQQKALTGKQLGGL